MEGEKSRALTSVKVTLEASLRYSGFFNSFLIMYEAAKYAPSFWTRRWNLGCGTKELPIPMSELETN